MLLMLQESTAKCQRAHSLSRKRALPPPFFAGNTRPEGLPGTNRGIEIQQTLPNDLPGTNPCFVSLFDPASNTAFYSAYKVTPQQAADLGKFNRNDINTRMRSWRDPPGMQTAINRIN